MNQAENDKLEAFLADLKELYIKHKLFIDHLAVVNSEDEFWVEAIELFEVKPEREALVLDNFVEKQIQFLRNGGYNPLS